MYKKLEEIKNKNYRIVSLGYNCLPRTVLTRWGIKPSKEQGELTLPFDLATFETYEITTQIKSNFDTFFRDLNFKKTDPKKNSKGFWKKEPNCIEFVHEKNISEEDRAELVKLYTKRIQNFRDAIKDTTPTLFIQVLGDCDDTKNLYSLIKNLKQDKPFKFAILDPFKITKQVDENIHILQTPYPDDEYQKNWWAKPYYSSKEGVFFEKQIADFCIDIIKTF